MVNPQHVALQAEHLTRKLNVLTRVLNVLDYGVIWLSILEFSLRLASHRLDLQPSVRRALGEDPTGVMCVFDHELANGQLQRGG